MKVTAQITTYHVDHELDQVVETTTEREYDVEIATPVDRLNEHWVYVGPGSARLERLAEDLPRLREHGWCVQSGTKPVKVTCGARGGSTYECCGSGGCQAGWGGRNYPQILVPGEEAVRLVEELMPA